MDLAQGEKNHDRSYPENGDREMLNDYTRQKLINEPTNDCNDKSYDRRQFSRQSLYSKSSFHSLYGDYSGVSNIKMCQKMCPKNMTYVAIRSDAFLYLICMYNINVT